MSYKVGATVVIDNSGNILWSRITTPPLGMLTNSTMTRGADVFRTIGAGNISTAYTETGLVYDSASAYHLIKTATLHNCNCNCNCANCNCNCYC